MRPSPRPWLATARLTLRVVLLLAMCWGATSGARADAEGAAGARDADAGFEAGLAEARTLFERASYADSLRLLAQLRQRADDAGRADLSVRAATRHAETLLWLGDEEGGDALLLQADRLRRDAKLQDPRLFAQQVMASLARRVSEHNRGRMASLVELAERLSPLLATPESTLALGSGRARLAASQGRTADALRFIALTLDDPALADRPHARTEALLQRFELRVAAGDLQAAVDDLKSAHGLVTRHALPEMAAEVLRHAADLVVVVGRQRDDLHLAAQGYGRWLDALKRATPAALALDAVTRELYWRRHRAGFERHLDVLNALHRQEKAAGWDRQAFAVLQWMKLAVMPVLPQPPRWPDSGTLDGIQRRLRTREALIDYLVTDRRASAFVVRADSLHWVDLGEPGWTQQLTGAVLQQLQAGEGGQLRRLEEFEPARAHALYRLAFEPLRPALMATDLAYLVPDGFLRDLPFEALVVSAVDNEGFAARRRATPGVLFDEYASLRFLVDDLALAYLPVGAALPVLMERREHRTAEPDRPLVAFADPVFARGDDPAALPPGDPRRALARLPGSAAEATAVAAALGARPEDLYLRDRASEAALPGAGLAAARYVLFSTHGVQRTRSSDGRTQASLVLSQPLDREASDGELTADEVARLSLAARLVVLSACRSAGGAMPQSATLPAAFLSAGADAVVGSRWMADADASRSLVTSLFEQPGSGTRAQTVARAKRLLKAGPARRVGGAEVSSAHPFFWAGFVLEGLGDEPERRP